MGIPSALKLKKVNVFSTNAFRFFRKIGLRKRFDYQSFLLTSLLLIAIPKVGISQSSNMYLHTDRDYYFPGDTVWFKGYFLSEGLFANNLHNMYMKLIDTQGKELLQAVAFINNGVTASHFRIPSNYAATEIYINAHTVLDSCADSKPYFKRLHILQIAKADGGMEPQGKPILNQGYLLNIIPEGGVLLSGVENKIILQVLDGDGYPGKADGKLVDDRGKVLEQFQTDSVGLAAVQLTAEADRDYTIEWTATDGNKQKNILPKAVFGSKINLVDQDSIVLVQLQTTKESENVFVSVGIGKRKLFDQELTLKSGKKINIPLQKRDIEMGILQASLFDTQQKVLSRRSMLLEQERVFLTPQVTFMGEFTDKSEGKINVQLPDGEGIAKMSVSVTDIAIPVDTTQSILTDLYFQPLSQDELRNPQTYWEGAKQKDLFIQAHKWNYTYCPTADSMIIDPILTIKGQINLEKKSFTKFYEEYQNEIKKGKKGNIPARGASFGYQDERYDRMQYTEVIFDKNGQFTVPNLIVFDSLDTKFVQVYRILKFTPFKVKYQFYDKKQFLKPIYYPQSLLSERSKLLSGNQDVERDDYLRDARGNRILQTAEVTSTRKQREIDRLQRRFQTVEPHTVHEPDVILLPLMDSVVIKRSQSLRDYVDRNLQNSSTIKYLLNGKMVIDPKAMNKTVAENPLQNVGVARVVEEQKGSNISFLDEDVSNYPYLKFYKTYSSAEFTGTNVLLVFEYSPAEVDRDIGKSEYYEKIMGYMPITEFTNKVYTTAKERLSSNSDNRVTLFWDPYFDFEEGTKNKAFTFYNNSKNKGVYVTVEGLTSSGKVIYYRKAYK
jgi:hypothetical protein